MKKTITFLIGILLAFVVSSCKKDALTVDTNTLDNSTYKCWYVTVSRSTNGINSSNSWYEYNTERWLVISLQKNKDVSGYSATYKEIKKYISQISCEGANEKEK